jgi:hypothetical protein
MRRRATRGPGEQNDELPASALGLRREDKAVGENDGDGGLREGRCNGEDQILHDDLLVGRYTMRLPRGTVTRPLKHR